MSKGLIFFCCACAILLFTIINLSVGPIISGRVGHDTVLDFYSGREMNFFWGTANCKYYADYYDQQRKTIDGDQLKYRVEWYKNECNNKKGMHDMEYTSFIFNIVIGFICALLGFLHLFDVKKEFVSKTGLIGLGCGIVGFIFSFVYVVLNGLVYTTYYDYNVDYDGSSYNPNFIYKRDSDEAFAELKNGKYECFYFDSTYNYHALRAKYSDLIQKQYNYDKDLIETYNNIDNNCKIDPSICTDKTIDPSDHSIPNTCKYLYVDSSQISNDVTNKDISDRFLTTLLLSLFVCLANIGLGIFGFLLYRTPGEF